MLASAPGNLLCSRLNRWVVARLSLALGIVLSANANPSLADDNSSMARTAQDAQNVQAALIPMVQLPLTYVYNQNRQANQNYRQSQFQFSPMIPAYINGTRGFIINPMFTDNINTQNQRTSNQATPLDLATYLVDKTGSFVYGMGPFIQIPTATPSAGSQQTGLGASYGFYYRPRNLVIGGTGYNAWGVGGNTGSGTANVYYYNMAVSYTTDNAWTYSLRSWINGNPTSGKSNNTNQLILSAGNTFKLGTTIVQWQVGPAYMVTKTPTSPQGWSGYASINIAFKE